MLRFLKPLVLISIIFVSGCVTTKNVNLSNTFDPLLTESMLAKGNNKIVGSALIRQKGGGVVTCAGSQVSLVPETPYSYERIRSIYGNSKKGFVTVGPKKVKVNFKPNPPQYSELLRTSVCDVQGYFKFEDVADGSFFVISSIIWQVNNYYNEGGVIMHNVKVSGGEVKELVLAP